MTEAAQRLAQIVHEKLEPSWRRQVAPQPEESWLTGQVGAFSARLARELQGFEPSDSLDFVAPTHVTNLGLALERVVAEFNLLRRCVFELAMAHHIPVAGAPLEIVNRVVDSAIATAVKALADQQSHRRVESLASAVHDLRSPLTAFSLATELLERLVHPVPESELRALLDIMRSSVRKQDFLFHRVLADEHPSPPEHTPSARPAAGAQLDPIRRRRPA